VAATTGLGAGLLQRYRIIIGEGIWVLTGQALTGLFTLVGTRLITQYVDPELYGLANLVQNALLLLRTLFCSPLLNAALRYYPDAQREACLPTLHATLLRSLAKAFLAMEVITVAGGLLWTWRENHDSRVVWILTAFVGFDVLRTLKMTLLNAARKQRAAAIVSAIEALSRPLLVVGAVLLFGPTLEAVLGGVAASIAIALLALYAGDSRHVEGGHNAVPLAMLVEMRRYALPLVPISIFNWLTSVSDRYLIQWLSHDLRSVGIYAAGYGLVSQAFLLLNAVIALTLRPVYFAAVSRQDEHHARRTFRAWITLSMAACVAATIVVLLARNLLVSTLLSVNYQRAISVVPWIAFGYLFYVLDQVLEQHLLAHKRTKAVLATQVGGGLICLIATVPFVAAFGMMGAAYACPVYFGFQAIIAALLVRAHRPPTASS
jgi:O-antigen/teichoic acid export membrane protein